MARCQVYDLLIRQLEGEQGADDPRKGDHVVWGVQGWKCGHIRKQTIYQSKEGNEIELIPAIPSFQVSTGWERRSWASCPAVSLALLVLGLRLRSLTRAATSRFSRLAWWAKKATTSMNLRGGMVYCWATNTYCQQCCPAGCDCHARKLSQQ